MLMGYERGLVAGWVREVWGWYWDLGNIGKYYWELHQFKAEQMVEFTK